MARAKASADINTLTEKQLAFVERYLTHFNGAQAARVAGYSAKSAATTARDLLQHPAIIAKLATRRSEIRKELQDTGRYDRDRILTELWEMATADSNDLIQLRRDACRYCHGIGHEYQYTEQERRRAEARHYAEAKEAGIPEEDIPPFIAAGGTGYNPNREPHPDCPECFGEGVERTIIADTRYLPAGARKLYAGIKITKDGMEVKQHSKDAAVDRVMKHLGLYEADNKQQGGNLVDSMRELISAAGGAAGGTLRPSPSNAMPQDDGDDE